MSEQSATKIQVCVRLRPLSGRERKSLTGRVAWRWGEEEQEQFTDEETIKECNKVPDTKSYIEQIWFPPGQQTRLRSTFYFDKLFGPKISTVPIYEAVGSNIIAAVIKGYHGAIFCYGQTSTGKTYTMQGSSNHPGLIPLTVADVFRHIEATNKKQFVLRVSYLEIYNETVNDLLRPSSVNLKIFDDPQLGVIIKGLEETLVVSQEQVFSLISAGESHRHVGSTNFNYRSSRSHTIFRLTIESREIPKKGSSMNDDDDDVNESHKRRRNNGKAALVSTLSLVDLAGSECATGTKRSKSRRREGGYINKSLLTLSHIILKLSDKAAAAAVKSMNGDVNGGENGGGHLPYRDSKLTRILKPALDGDSKMSIICTLSPSAISFSESLNTLKFASRAKKIQSKAIINKVEDETALIIRYQHEIAKLKAELETAQMEAKNAKIISTTTNNRKSSKPLPPRLSREDALANRELRNALKQAIANIGRVILNSQGKKKKKKKRKKNTPILKSEEKNQEKKQEKEQKKCQLVTKQSAGESAGEVMVHNEKMLNDNKKEDEKISIDCSSSFSTSSSSSSVDEFSNSDEEGDNNAFRLPIQTPINPDSTVKLTKTTSIINVETPISIRQSHVNTEPNFFHTERSSTSSSSLISYKKEEDGEEELRTRTTSNTSNLSISSSISNTSPRLISLSKESVDADLTDEEITLSPSALLTRRKLLKVKDKATIQGELDDIRAHLMDLLHQMKTVDDEIDDHHLVGDEHDRNHFKGTASISPIQEHKKTIKLVQKSLDDQEDYDLKRQVLHLQHQVEEQALKFSVSQADSSFLTDVLAKKDQILQECQALLVELDARHHHLWTRNAELEKILIEKEKEINRLKNQLIGTPTKSAALQKVESTTAMLMRGTSAELNVQSNNTLNMLNEIQEEKDEPPSYESLMEKISKLQAENSPLKKVANVAGIAVHWKHQIMNSNHQDDDDEYEGIEDEELVL
jgi:centromeric protein E